MKIRFVQVEDGVEAMDIQSEDRYDRWPVVTALIRAAWRVLVFGRAVFVVSSRPLEVDEDDLQDLREGDRSDPV